MNKRKSIGLNAILNVIKTGLSIIFPLITYPYAVRVLGAEGVGKVSYGYSIVSYFSLIAMLGISTYAVREGSRRKDNKEKLTEFSSQIFSINILTTVISYILLGISLIYIGKFRDYRLLLIIQSLSIVFATLSIDWINTIFEDFMFITVRSIIAHIVSLFLLFIIVRTPNDYYLYALLTVITDAITCVSNWIYCRKYIKIRLTWKLCLHEHLKPLFIFFGNALMISVYVNFDTTMIGWIRGDRDVGLYTISVKIYTIIKSILSAIYIVAIPRLALLIAQDKKTEYKKIYTSLVQCLTLVLIPVGAGIICTANEIMMLMGGREYISASVSLQILAGALVFSIYGGLITACLNVTIGREKKNLIATIISAGINFGLNLFFIPQFGINGAAFTTLLSELFVAGFCYIGLPNKKDYFDKNRIFISIFHAIIGCVEIVIISIVFKNIFKNYIYQLCSIIVFSIFIYGLTLFKINDEIFINNFNIVKSRLHQKGEIWD